LIFPAVGGVYLSLNDYTNNGLEFVGIDGYQKAITSGDAARAFRTTVVFMLLSVLLSVLFGLVLAIFVNMVQRGKAILRTIFMIPWPILDVVVGIIFLWMFNAQYGVINELLLELGIIDQYRSWLSTASSAFAIVVGASVWKSIPFNMIMILASLQAIPQEQYEAAAVDGASWWQQLYHITLPNLRQIILIVTMLQLIWRFRTFDLVAIMTNGGPNNATEVLSVLVIRYVFTYFRFGEGAAIAVLMSLISLIFTIFYIRALFKSGVQESRV
jgi:multiple sugar transport system permease protein